MINYLDKTGFIYFWNKLKECINPMTFNEAVDGSKTKSKTISPKILNDWFVNKLPDVITDDEIDIVLNN